MGQPVALTDIPGILYQAGFRGTGLINAMAVAIAEAGYTGQDNSTGNSPAGSVDRGLFQINSYWHSEVSNACAADPLCNAEAAFRISSGGTNWSSWSTWQKGIAQQYVSQATALLGPFLGTLGNIAGFAGSIGAYQTPGAASNPATYVAAAPTIAQTAETALPSAVTNPGGDIASALNNLASQLSTGVNNATSGLTQLHDFVSWLGQPNLWTRIVLAVVGVLVLLVGLVLFGVSFLPKGTKVLPIPT